MESPDVECPEVPKKKTPKVKNKYLKNMLRNIKNGFFFAKRFSVSWLDFACNLQGTRILAVDRCMERPNVVWHRPDASYPQPNPWGAGSLYPKHSNQTSSLN